MNTENLFSNLPQKAPQEVIEALLKNKSFSLKRVISTGQATAPGEWYDQTDDEWCILLSGSAGLQFEGEEELVVFKPGDHIVIPAHKRHRINWTDATVPSVWIVLHYPAE